MSIGAKDGLNPDFNVPEHQLPRFMKPRPTN